MEVDKQILPYLGSHTPTSLGISDFSSANINKLRGGDYNLNYHVIAQDRELLVRVNIEPQSGSDAQVEYEYNTLDFLKDRGVTPRPFFVDNSRDHLPYGLLIEEYIPGKHLEFSVDAMKRVATAMAILHTTPIDGAPLYRREHPFRDQVEAVATDLARYKLRRNPNREIVRLGQIIVTRLQRDVQLFGDQYGPISVVHTDPNPANIIDNGQKVFFIDWEQGRIDDPSYDIAALFSDVLNLWASPRILTPEEKKAFLDTYTKETKNHRIVELIGPRLMAYTLNASIWAANRIMDVDEGKIDPNLGEQNYTRYKTMSDPSELQKVLSL